VPAVLALSAENRKQPNRRPGRFWLRTFDAAPT
jgi:hypothetical protein